MYPNVGIPACHWQVNNADVVPRLLGTSLDFLHSYMAYYLPALGVRYLQPADMH